MNHWQILDGFGGDRVVAVRPQAVRVLGASAAIFLARALFWQAKNPSYWWSQTQVELEEQTGLSVDAQQTARVQLKNLGILNERRVGMPAQLEYLLNYEAVKKILVMNHE